MIELYDGKLSCTALSDNIRGGDGAVMPLTYPIHKQVLFTTNKMEDMYLIRQLAKKYKLTRTSLLHYDAIGLLSPSARTEAGYRLYSEEDEKKLQNILLFRSMGISLDSIRRLLEYNESKLANALLIRLNELNHEI